MPVAGQYEYQGKQEQGRPCYCCHERLGSLAHGLEHNGADHDEADEVLHEEDVPGGVASHVDHSAVGREDTDEHLRNEVHGKEHRHADRCSRDDSQPYGLQCPVIPLCAVVETENRLQAHTDDHGRHEGEHHQAVDQSVGRDGYVAAEGGQRPVDEDDRQTAGRQIGECRNADGKNGPEDAPVDYQVLRVHLEEALAGEIVAGEVDGGDYRGYQGAQRSASDPHAQQYDEHGIQYDVQDGTDDHPDHGYASIALRSYQPVLGHGHRLEGHRDEYERHVVPGVGQDRLRCSHHS